jgi:hypothetical protein
MFMYAIKRDSLSYWVWVFVMHTVFWPSVLVLSIAPITLLMKAGRHSAAYGDELDTSCFIATIQARLC